MACFCACRWCLAGYCCRLSARPVYPSIDWERWHRWWMLPWMSPTPVAVFSPAVPTCPKCGGQGLGVKWHTADYACNHAGVEHLHRTCRTCGYDWSEPTDDAKLKEAMKKAVPTTTVEVKFDVSPDEVKRAVEHALEALRPKVCTCPKVTTHNAYIQWYPTTAGSSTTWRYCEIHGMTVV
jgi:hypothetical protein